MHSEKFLQKFETIQRALNPEKYALKVACRMRVGGM